MKEKVNKKLEMFLVFWYSYAFEIKSIFFMILFSALAIFLYSNSYEDVIINIFANLSIGSGAFYFYIVLKVKILLDINYYFSKGGRKKISRQQKHKVEKIRNVLLPALFIVFLLLFCFLAFYIILLPCYIQALIMVLYIFFVIEVLCVLDSITDTRFFEIG